MLAQWEDWVTINAYTNFFRISMDRFSTGLEEKVIRFTTPLSYSYDAYDVVIVRVDAEESRVLPNPDKIYPGGTPAPPWPGLYPPVKGPEPNPYPFPEEPCTLYTDAYRYNAGANLTGDFNFGTMLQYLDIAGGQTTKNLTSSTPNLSTYTVGGFGSLTLYPRLLGVQASRITQAFPVSGTCAEFSTVTVVDQNGTSGPGNLHYRSDTFPGFSGSSSVVAYLYGGLAMGVRINGETSGAEQFGAEIWQSFDDTYNLRVSVHGVTDTVQFTYPGWTNSPRDKIQLNITWATTEFAGGGMTCTASVVGIVSVSVNSPTGPSQNLLPSGYLDLGSSFATGTTTLFSSYAVTDALSQEQQENLNESSEMNTGWDF